MSPLIFMAKHKRVYILYDDRAADGLGTSDASVLVVCEDEQEAREYCGEFGAMACYSYREDGENLIDERHEWNWFPH